jgi:hypothetical protein
MFARINSVFQSMDIGWPGQVEVSRLYLEACGRVILVDFSFRWIAVKVKVEVEVFVLLLKL